MAEEKTVLHYLRLRGLPYTVREPEVRAFFDGLDVDDVQLIQSADGRASGEAFVGFATAAGADSGLQRDKNKIGTRYIEVFRVTEPEFVRIRTNNGGPHIAPATGASGGGGGYDSGPRGGSYDGPSGGGRGGRGRSRGGPSGGGGMAGSVCVRIRGLPFSCKQADLIGFFSGLNVEEVVFGKEPGEGGRPTGEGYVRFRYLELFRADYDQFERFKRQNSSDPYGHHGGGGGYADPWASWYPQQEDVYGWDSYGMPVAAGRGAPPRGPGGYRGGRGGYRGGYDGGNARPSPYDYHGRVYGGDQGYGGPPQAGYEGYGYGAASYGHHAQAAPEANSACKIHMRGLPFRVSVQQLTEFFAPLNCVEIKLGYLPDGRVSGDGIIEFNSPDDAQEAMRRDRQMIGTRYIEIFAPNTVKVAPGTTYKRVGGSGSAVKAENAGGYQW
uniref:RRM domain-containing protein n=1 Tax=Panagrellus redivivus TaxID=6233 RepID=A0A7E4ZTE8_PANRE